MCLLERLVGIGVGAERDGRAFVARRREFFSQYCGSVGFVKKFGFEVEAGGKADVGVAGAWLTTPLAMKSSVPVVMS